jgi:hypothetical protein
MPRFTPPEPISAYPEPAAGIGAITSGDGVAAVDEVDEPVVPDEARARIVADATADAPVAAGPETVLHVRFEGGARPDRLISAMETVKLLLRDRPGGTRVVIHVPSTGGGTTLPMELRWGVAYDAELLAEVRRRCGDGVVELRLMSA